MSKEFLDKYKYTNFLQAQQVTRLIDRQTSKVQFLFYFKKFISCVTYKYIF